MKIALVTGANRGIGFEIVKGLAEKDIHVYLSARNYTAAENAWKELGSPENVEPIQLDVTDMESIHHAFSEIIKKHQRIDVLINNAGVFIDDDITASSLDLDSIRKTLEVNTFGALRLCQAVLPGMKEQGYGRIVNISSVMGSLSEATGSYGLAYRMSKAALNMVTRTLASEAGAAVKINSMCPGWCHTDMGGKDAPKTPHEGADTAIWLATLPEDGPTSGFFREREAVPW